MKKTIRMLMAVGCLTALAAITATHVSAKDEKDSDSKKKTEPIGSIRPTGKVEKADLPGLAQISFGKALKAAEKAVPGGKVIKGKLEVEDGNLIYSFDIVAPDKTIMEAEIDAGDGKVLDVDKD
jgi:uncharacterized membrane protein YkoI